ncbi:hypothetical protein Pfo_031486 [Paulownia fortunei]|nr:hypothetical protein Pfo_031486 [Paulownia fortunei]
MSPNVTDIKPIVKAVELAVCRWIGLNQYISRDESDLAKRAPSLVRGIGGLSGGVTQVDDALELMMAGASAVQVGSAIATNPTIMTDIIAALPKALDKYGFTDVTEVTRNVQEKMTTKGKKHDKSTSFYCTLDFPDGNTALNFLEPFKKIDKKPAIKVGMELFFAEGPDFVRDLRQKGFDIFLDLKLYDIPNTVGHAVANIAKLDVQYLTLHAAGGTKMMTAAVANKGQNLKNTSSDAINIFF